MMQPLEDTATAALYDGLGTELLVGYTDRSTGVFHTLQFQETRADLGETELVLQFDWVRGAPPGAPLVLPLGGLPLSKIDDYWVLWGQNRSLFAQSAHHSSLMISRLAEGEMLIDRPQVTGNRELHVYGWTEGRLVRHRFAATGESRGEGTVETVLDEGAAPARSISAPVPGDSGGTAAIGLVNEIGGEIAASVLYVRGDSVVRLDGRAEGQYSLMPSHRMGLHVGKKARPALAMMTVSREDGSYSLLEARFDFGKKQCVWKRTRLEAVSPGDLRSAAVFYYKTQDAPDPFLFAVNQNGDLLSVGRRTIQISREGVGPGYAYPILTTTANRYEVLARASNITLQRI